MNHRAVVYLLAVSVFVMATSELVVAGILTMIADDLQVSIGTAGQLVTVYAVGIALGSPVLLSAVARMERRRLLLLSCFVFAVGNLLAFVSFNYAMLAVSRVVQAASVGVFTVVALAEGAEMASPDKRGSAIGVILTGASAALVLGVPLGTLVGEQFGWRIIFLLISVASIPLMIGIATLVPRIESKEVTSLKAQVAILRDRRIVSALLITLFWAMGCQIVFAYISPFLEEVAGLTVSQISAALFICGVFAVVGSRIGGYGADRWGMFRVLVISLVLHAAALLLLPWAATSWIGAFVILAVWIGSAYMTTPVQQYYLVSLSPNTSSLTLGLNNSVLQLSIAFGAGVGGWVVNESSVKHLGWVGALSVAISMLAALYSFSLRDAQPKEPQQSNA
jgi:predicted MFS family arabinose efflux permease